MKVWGRAFSFLGTDGWAHFFIKSLLKNEKAHETGFSFVYKCNHS